MEEKNNASGGNGSQAQAGSAGNAGDDIAKKLASLEATVKDQEAKLRAQNEELAKTTALLEAAWDPRAGGGANGNGNGAGDDPSRLASSLGRDFVPLGIPNEAAAALIDVAEERIRKTMRAEYDNVERQKMMRKQAQDKFYADNPELKEYPELVGVFANQVQNEFPNMKIPEAMSEVAKRTRDWVAKRIPPSGNEPPNVLGASSSGRSDKGSGTGKDDFRLLSDEESLREEMDERVASRRKQFQS